MPPWITSTPPSKLACRTVSLQIWIVAPTSLDLSALGVLSRPEGPLGFGAVGLAGTESSSLPEEVMATSEPRVEMD
jgi:hypothetical protein